jgi:hypothetical protein
LKRLNPAYVEAVRASVNPCDRVLGRAYSQAPGGIGMTTVDLKLNYLAPLTRGRMIGKGKCLRAGGTLYLAHGTSTLMLLKNAPMKADLPAKFLD